MTKGVARPAIGRGGLRQPAAHLHEAVDDAGNQVKDIAPAKQGKAGGKPFAVGTQRVQFGGIEIKRRQRGQRCVRGMDGGQAGICQAAGRRAYQSQ